MNARPDPAASTAPRRPIKARNSRWAAAVAAGLARCGVRPNTISMLSAAFAGLAGLCMLLTRDAGSLTAPILLVGGAVCIQLRLLCNLFDGMVAVEGGFKTKSGEIFTMCQTGLPTR